MQRVLSHRHATLSHFNHTNDDDVVDYRRPRHITFPNHKLMVHFTQLIFFIFCPSTFLASFLTCWISVLNCPRLHSIGSKKLLPEEIVQREMKNSVSEQRFYIESDEEDEEKFSNKDEDSGTDNNDEDGESDNNDENGENDSDSTRSSMRDGLQSKRNSYQTSWPQTYRFHSIDFFLLSLFCLFLLGINVLCGVGLLSTPYAIKEGGWLSLSILFIFALLSFYTGILLRFCSDSAPEIETYPDIGQAAFGKIGRLAISIVLYMELYACCVEHIILESDNLSSLFPNAHLNLGGYELDSHHLFALASTLTVLPTCWLRDLSVLSYISAGGVVAIILVVLCLFWVGFVDQIGFYGKGLTVNYSTFPVAIGIYGYCYSGHAVFPNIYTSMAKPRQYPSVLLTSFIICTTLYAGVAVLGYMMFGESTQSQFTLNMPQDLVATKIALWTTVVSPFTKYPFSWSYLPRRVPIL
ncbi:hypothetical protein Nepgr_012389 [Nepenthes gracilis]|uniref:Amino acid transporter transmembrane domain-containing protein n=1 Tax=Nepenthes gracilis TaxID=150966 RepID=A0AAD3SFX2_NEPGR|nr:hypothetical protein Nepgr_012389 [Nepenthes gracilis]